ncbi:hypothetical protein [Natrinema sp. HArc-T2]|uniref:hypothetical protein n=1 Tax=Natrinema sp. HArc-T2 TaxID=3242701 RepID=UPI00359EE472
MAAFVVVVLEGEAIRAVEGRLASIVVVLDSETIRPTEGRPASVVVVLDSEALRAAVPVLDEAAVAVALLDAYEAMLG